jgi:DNA-binding response OmpR family regulator
VVEESTGRPERAARARILIAEDDAMIRDLMCSVLRRAGFEVCSAGTGAQAIALCKQQRPTLLVLDGLLPDTTGRKTAECLRADPATRSMPILFASALDDAEARGGSDAAPWDATIRKPFSPSDLVAAVNALVGGPSRADAPTVTSADTPPVTAIAREMRRGYGEALRDAVAHMESALASAHSWDESGANLEALRARLHQIGGSAATFGFARIGEIAAQAEAVVRRWQETAPGTPPAPDLDQLRSAIRRIGPLLQETAGNPGNVAAAENASTGPAAPAHVPTARLLILHNDAAFLKASARAALKLGYEIETSDSPLSIIERLRQAQFSTIVVGGEPALQSDCEWVRTVRQASPESALVLVGGDGSTEHRIAAARAGVDRYLAGQPSVEELVGEWQALEEANSARHGRVLVIDDDPAIRDFVEAVLRHAGCEVVCVGDGSTLFADLDRCDPDLLLLDVDMPNATGLELTRAVRASARWSKLPIVIQTAHTDTECRLQAFENGADDFISKPLLEEELRARVLTRLERERAKRDSAETDPVTRFRGRHWFLEASRHRVRSNGGVLAVIELKYLDRVVRRRGLDAADQAVAAVAAGLRSSFRSARDLVARIKEDLFAVLVTDCDARVLATRLELCCARLDYDPRLRPEGHPAEGVGLEVGVTSLTPGQGVGDVLDAAVRETRAPVRNHVRMAEFVPANAPLVYLIEDDEHLRELVGFALTSAGYEVKAYRSGSEGLHALIEASRHAGSGERPVVLLDIELPDIDGFRVLDEITTTRPGHYRVILLTGRTNPGDRVRGLRAGAVEFVSKPVRISALLAAVQGCGPGPRATAP